jgi:hypothetical protein
MKRLWILLSLMSCVDEPIENRNCLEHCEMKLDQECSKDFNGCYRLCEINTESFCGGAFNQALTCHIKHEAACYRFKVCEEYDKKFDECLLESHDTQ